MYTTDAYAGCRPAPMWVDSVGLVSINPDINSIGVELNWDIATPVYPQDQVYYNIYYSVSRFGVFTEGPKLITSATDVVVPIVQPGIGNFFGVRATEFDPSFYDITQLQQVGQYLYQYPENQILQNDIDAYSLVITVPSTEGFANSGFLLLDFEVIEYSMIDGNNFIVPVNGRGQILTLPTEHTAGGFVSQWHGVEDNNSFIHRGVRDWNEDQIPYIPDSYGQFNADIDGYRAHNGPSDLLSNLGPSDAANEPFDYYGACGFYGISSPYDVLSGNVPCGTEDGSGTYTSGDNGIRGGSIQDTLLGRLDLLLDTTGQPVILLRRKWTGRRCSCISLRREIARSRCSACYGTGFLGGYDRYYNPRSIAQNIDNTAGFIMTRISPFNDIQKLEDKQSIRQDVTVTGWTLTVPSIFERDILITRDPTEQFEDFRYEITSVTRNVTFFGQSGSQQFNMYRLDRTDEIYTYKIL